MLFKFEKNIFLLSYARKFSKDIFLALIFILISTLSILFIGFVIQTLTKSLMQGSNFQDITYFSFVIFLSIITSSCAVFGRIYFFGQLGEKLIKALRDSLFKHLISQDVYFFESHRVGEIVSRIMADTHVIQIVLIGSFSSAVRNSIMFLGGSLMMLLISPLLFFILCIGAIFITIPSILFGRKIRQFSKNAQMKSADISSHIEEIVNSIKTIKANDYEADNIQEFCEKSLAECLTVCKRIIYFGFSVSTHAFLSFSFLIGIVCFAYTSQNLCNLSPSSISSFAYYGIIAGYSLSQFNDLIADFYRARGASDRIRELFKISPSLIVKKNLHINDHQSNAYLQFKNVNFSYPSNLQHKILRNINFEIYPGERIALVGASGSGKSTIFNLVLRFYDPLAGTILFKQRDIKSLAFKEFRSKISIVPQDPFLFSTSILKNIQLGMHNCSIDEIRKTAELSYCLDFIEKSPNGFDTYVGEKGMRLSGGQKQRIAIARAILRNPELLLLDEATSSLDSESEYYIKLSLEKFLKNKTCFIIAHRLSTIRNCDKILLMENGQIIDMGTHEQLINSNAYYSKLVKMQFMEPIPLQSA